MDAPTPAEIREWSKLDFGEKGFSDDDDLQRLIDIGSALLTNITGQTYAAMPTELVPMAQMAIRGFTEQLAFEQQVDYLETLSDFDLIQAFSAGPYSETRRDPGQAFKARMLNAWPWLSDLLWKMLTPKKYDYWIEFFAPQEVPAFAVTEVEWSPPPLDDFTYGA